MYLLFDVINTVYGVWNLPQALLNAYADHLTRFRAEGTYKRLNFSDEWRKLGAWNHFLDAYKGLQYEGHKLITLSNMPIDVQIDVARSNNINWDFMVPLEAFKTFKPNINAYTLALDLLRIKPEQAMMITANKDFGDLEAAIDIGMKPVWIDYKKTGEKAPDGVLVINVLSDLAPVLRQLSV